VNGEVAEAIALVAHGNAFLAGLTRPVELTDGNSAFRWVGAARFGESTTTRAWFEALRDAGARRLELVLPGAKRLFAGFSNAVPAAIRVEPRGELWTARWELIDPRPADGRIWSVVHERREAPPETSAPPTLPGATAELRAVLAEVETVARRDDFLAGFAGAFRTAAAQLDDRKPTPPYPDLLPDGGYTIEARRLLAASGHAWVFGGMGSWNDVTFGDKAVQADYERVSELLWRAILDGLRAAVNAFDGDRVD